MYGLKDNNITYLPAYCEIISVDEEHKSSLIKIIITEGKYHQVKNMFKVNLDCRVFKATQDDPVIRFTDKAVKPGRKTALNYIYITPFFEEE